MKQALVIVFTIALLIFLTFTVVSIKKTNEELKNELRELKIELDSCKKERIMADSSYQSLFGSYIDLGLRCGANE